MVMQAIGKQQYLGANQRNTMKSSIMSSSSESSKSHMQLPSLLVVGGCHKTSAEDYLDRGFGHRPRLRPLAAPYTGVQLTRLWEAGATSAGRRGAGRGLIKVRYGGRVFRGKRGLGNVDVDGARLGASGAGAGRAATSVGAA